MISLQMKTEGTENAEYAWRCGTSGAVLEVEGGDGRRQTTENENTGEGTRQETREKEDEGEAEREQKPSLPSPSSSLPLR